jgi:hypothetical protein
MGWHSRNGTGQIPPSSGATIPTSSKMRASHSTSDTSACVQACEPLAAQSMAKQREMETYAQRLGFLFWQLNCRQLSPPVIALLSDFASSVSQFDWPAVQRTHMKLTGSHWDECGQWLQAVKRLSKARQALP